MHIRIATSLDQDKIQSVHWSAFDESEREIISKLIESGMQQVSRMGVDILFVYGDPKYYSRFGFTVDAAECYIPPYSLEYPFGWHADRISRFFVK